MVIQQLSYSYSLYPPQEWTQENHQRTRRFPVLWPIIYSRIGAIIGGGFEWPLAKPSSDSRLYPSAPVEINKRTVFEPHLVRTHCSAIRLLSRGAWLGSQGLSISQWSTAFQRKLNIKFEFSGIFHQLIKWGVGYSELIIIREFYD